MNRRLQIKEIIKILICPQKEYFYIILLSHCQYNIDKKEEPKREITNDTLMGIAAAIWNYQKENYGGWGANGGIVL